MASQPELAKPKRLRLFIAVNLPEEIRQAIALIPSHAVRLGKSVRWIRADQLHLTLKFLGHLPEAAATGVAVALNEACHRSRPFRLRSQGIGCFPGTRNPRIIWVGIAGDLEPLCDLQRRIDLATSPWAAPEERPFRPHLTIGRIAEPRALNRAVLERLIKEQERSEFGEWTVEAIDLMQSHLSPQGSIYTRLNSARLSD